MFLRVVSQKSSVCRSVETIWFRNGALFDGFAKIFEQFAKKKTDLRSVLSKFRRFVRRFSKEIGSFSHRVARKRARFGAILLRKKWLGQSRFRKSESSVDSEG